MCTTCIFCVQEPISALNSGADPGGGAPGMCPP